MAYSELSIEERYGLNGYAPANATDNLQQLIKFNGLQVSPAELEAILGENSQVSDAAVVGVAT
jgi:acyl-CoA synthetase (AMP-forming)/AMP-acid ligase II